MHDPKRNYTTALLDGQCPRCFVLAIEGDWIAGYACCYCGWDRDLHQSGVALAKNGRRFCGVCRWFARPTDGGQNGLCLHQSMLLGNNARRHHPSVDQHHWCDKWRLMPRARHGANVLWTLKVITHSTTQVVPPQV